MSGKLDKQPMTEELFKNIEEFRQQRGTPGLVIIFVLTVADGPQPYIPM